MSCWGQLRRMRSGTPLLHALTSSSSPAFPTPIKPARWAADHPFACPHPVLVHVLLLEAHHDIHGRPAVGGGQQQAADAGAGGDDGDLHPARVPQRDCAALIAVCGDEPEERTSKSGEQEARHPSCRAGLQLKEPLTEKLDRWMEAPGPRALPRFKSRPAVPQSSPPSCHIQLHADPAQVCPSAPCQPLPELPEEARHHTNPAWTLSSAAGALGWRLEGQLDGLRTAAPRSLLLGRRLTRLTTCWKMAP